MDFINKYQLLKISLVLFFFTGFCFNVKAQKEIFLRQIEWKLENVSTNEYENEYFMTMKFNKGESYLFKVVNHLEDMAGQAIIQILDADNLVLTNLLNEKYFETISFVCNKTGFYDVLVRFRDDKPGNSVIDIKLMQ